MIIKEFIEHHQEIYRLDKNTFSKIKTKVSRELNKIPSWFEIQDKQPVGKTTAYVLDDETIAALTKAMRPYFQKLANIKPEDLKKNIRTFETRIETETGFIKDNRISDESYNYSVPKEDKLYVMIEALFNERFELDEDAWNADYTNYQLFVSDEDTELSESVVLSSYRLKNPMQNYVKNKK